LGCRVVINSPALEWAEIATVEKVGCAERILSNSPPAYPLAPTTPIFMGAILPEDL
jgi:hypothetical protein